MAYREEELGTWFIRAFILEMYKHCHKEHLADIMTKVISKLCLLSLEKAIFRHHIPHDMRRASDFLKVLLKFKLLWINFNFFVGAKT